VCAALAYGSGAMAQPYPNRPITLIVPYGASSPLDTLTRIVSDRMRVPFRQLDDDGSLLLRSSMQRTPERD